MSDPFRVCIWDAFGSYSCRAPASSVSGRAMFPATFLEGFADPGTPQSYKAPVPHVPPQLQRPPQPEPQGAPEGFCGCGGANLP